MKKVAYVKLENTIKRHYKGWQDLIEMFANYNKSSTKEQLKQNEINFVNKFNDLLVQLSDCRKEETKNKGKGTKSSGNSGMNIHFLESIKLSR